MMVLMQDYFAAAPRMPFAALVTAILLLSALETTNGETAAEETADCPYQYLVVPQPEYNCNPIGQAAVRVPLSCTVAQTAEGPPNPFAHVRWYWTPDEEDAGISGVWIIETSNGEFDYSLREEIHTLPIGQLRISTITIDFNENNTGYYWCQVALDQDTLLTPSPVIFIEQRSTLLDCKNDDLSVPLVGSDVLCAQLSSNTTNTSSAAPPRAPSNSSGSSGLLVWQSLVGAVLLIAIIVVLMFSLITVYSVRKARRKRSTQARPTGGIPNATSRTDLSRTPSQADLRRTQSQADLWQTPSHYAIAPLQTEEQEAAHQQPLVGANPANDGPEQRQPPRITSASIALYTVPNGAAPLHLEMSTFLQNRNVNQVVQYEPLRRETIDYMNVYSSCVQKNSQALSESESVCSDGVEKQLDNSRSYEEP